MTKAALTADAIAAQVTPKIAANIRDGAAPLIAAQFIVPSGAEIAGKIKLPTASDIAGKISVPSANEIARAALEQQPVEMRALAKALVDQGFKPPTPNDLFQALRESKNLPSREELADALAKSLVNDAIPSVQSGFGDRLIKALRSSHVACETIVVALKNAIDSAEERQRLATLLQGS